MEPLRADDPPRIGRYRLVARLGAGGSGRVFLAQAPSGGLVAVKVVHARFAHRQDRRERFAREVADTITVPGSLLGTPGYIPPEHIRDRRSGREGDVFALGAVLVYAATGEGPYGVGSAPVLLYRTQSEEPRLDGLRAAVDDPGLVDTVASCLARDPARRPTADALVERFAEAPDPAGTGWLPEDVAASVTDAARPRKAPDAPPAPDAAQAPDGSAESGNEPGRRPSRRVLLAAGGGAAALAALGASVPVPLSARTGTGAARRRSSTGQGPLWTYGVLYTAGPGGVYALDAARGTVRWSRAVGATVSAAVTVAGGLVLAGDENGRLHALDAATGRPRWRLDTDGPLRAAPVATAGTVLAGADNDRLYAVGAADGRVRWSRPVGRQTEVRAQVWWDRVVVCVDLTRLCAFAL